MYENEITKLFSEIHSPAFGSEIDFALKTSKLTEMKSRAIVREIAASSEKLNQTSDEFRANVIAALNGKTTPTPADISITVDLSDRRSTNNWLRANGYKWNKEIADWRDEGEVEDNYTWVLRSPNGRAVSVEQAIKEINSK